MNNGLLRLLMAGEYICPFRYPNEFRTLESEQTREQVDAWLESLNMRLARLGEDGAWYMAYSRVTEKAITLLKGELLKFRDVYGDAVRMLDFIRQAKAENASCTPGERIQLVELETLVRSSSTLGAQLRELVDVIHNAAARISDRENLRRLMEHLAKDGYVFLVDKTTDTYQVTGKIEQLYSVLRFLDENDAIGEQEVDDQMALPEDGAPEGVDL